MNYNLFSNRKVINPLNPLGNLNATQTTATVKQPDSTNAIGQNADGSYIYAKTPSTVTPPVTPSAPVTSTYDNLAKNATNSAKAQEIYYNNLNKINKEESDAQKATALRTQQENIAKNNANVEAIKASGDIEKGQIAEQVGADQLQSAKSSRESRNRLQQLFAGLGTLDSSSFQNNAQNLEQNLLTEQAGIRSKGAASTGLVTAKVEQARRDAEILAIQEQGKLDDTIAQIDRTYRKGTLEYNKAISDAYATADKNIQDIQIKLAELSAKNDTTAGLSESMLKTGVPSTMADFIWRAANPADAEKLATIGTSAQGGNKSKALTLVDNILNGNIKGISGAWREGNIPGLNVWTGAGKTQTEWEGLKSMLSLEGRTQLKGSGQISDFESKMLEKAAMAGIDPSRMSTADFEAALKQLKSDLESGGAVNNQAANQTIRVKNLQTGETGSLPISEYDPSIYQKI